MSGDAGGLGAPISYLVAEAGLPVYTRDLQRVGTLVYVLATESEDIFEGLVVTLGEDDFRYADREQVTEIHERGVVLDLDRAGAEGLHRPSENPAAMRATPGDAPLTELEQRLRRAWDYLTGNY
jgi:hypothetical protein